MSKIGRYISSGRTSEVYEWENADIIKLFNKNYNQGLIDREVEISEKIYKAGLPVPGVKSVEKINNRCGIVYEKLVGESLTNYLRKNPWHFNSCIKYFIGLHKQIHQSKVPGLPSQKMFIIEQIKNISQLNDEEKFKLLDLLKMLPDDDKLCHGDYHPENIIVTSNGPKIIDWSAATTGNTLADVAQTAVILRFGSTPDDSSLYFNSLLFLTRSLLNFEKIYTNRYFYPKKTPNQFKSWYLLAAVSRLDENILKEKASLLMFIEKELNISRNL